MWLKAQEDGKAYECVNGDMAYSKKYGLVDKYNFNEGWGLEALKDNGAKGLDVLLGECVWQEMGNVMTVEEAEKAFGVRIVNAY